MDADGGVVPGEAAPVRAGRHLRGLLSASCCRRRRGMARLPVLGGRGPLDPPRGAGPPPRVPDEVWGEPQARARRVGEDAPALCEDARHARPGELGPVLGLPPRVRRAVPLREGAPAGPVLPRCALGGLPPGAAQAMAVLSEGVRPGGDAPPGGLRRPGLGPAVGAPARHHGLRYPRGGRRGRCPGRLGVPPRDLRLVYPRSAVRAAWASSPTRTSGRPSTRAPPRFAPSPRQISRRTATTSRSRRSWSPRRTSRRRAGPPACR